MKLSHKLLILVFVPVCFEIGFVSELGMLESAAQKKADEARNAKEIIYEVNHLLQLVYESAASTVLREKGSNTPRLIRAGQDLAILIGDYLRAQNHLVDVVDDGDKALEMLLAFTYDVAVLDWMMPGCTGQSVCARYRKKGGGTPILMMTALSDIEHKERDLVVALTIT